MLQSRIIPCLLLHKGGLVKTVRFRKPKYVGDPINAVKIFNEKEVDEILIIDIDATVEKRSPNYEQIEDIVSEAFMPVGYGGGVTTVEQMQKLYYSGVEKVSLSSSALATPELVRQASDQFGSQSVIVTLDIKRSLFNRKYQVVTHNGGKKTKLDPISTAKQMEQYGAGELIINNVDNDGVMKGYDTSYMKQIIDAVNIPVIPLGGAGNLQHLQEIIIDGGASAAAAGSIFVFHGKHKAVLINYPSHDSILQLLGRTDYE
jgi:imidazole glycerol-phosphate synthase subunit HisF